MIISSVQVFVSFGVPVQLDSTGCFSKFTKLLSCDGGGGGGGGGGGVGSDRVTAGFDGEGCTCCA